MFIPDHARGEMEQSGISEEEVRTCLEYGESIIKQLVKGEMRYGKEMAFKDKKIIVIYTYRDNEERVVTVYPVRRKKQW